MRAEIGRDTFFSQRRLARRLSRGEPVPADEEQTVTVELPADPEFEVELEQEGETVSLDIEVEWPAADGTIVTDAHASKATFDRYEDNAEQWRWRLRHENGEIIADGGQGYASKQKAKQGSEA